MIRIIIRIFLAIAPIIILVVRAVDALVFDFLMSKRSGVSAPPLLRDIVSIVLYTFDTRPISIEILSNLRLQDLGMAAVYGVLLMTASAAAFLLWGQGEAR